MSMCAMMHLDILIERFTARRYDISLERTSSLQLGAVISGPKLFFCVSCAASSRGYGHPCKTLQWDILFGTFKHRVQHISLILLFFLLFLITAIFHTSAYAVEINKIIFFGNTVDIDLYALLGDKSGDLSEREIEAIGVVITDEYHRRGYTTSYVDKFILRKDGVLEIYIRESRILGLKVSGIGDSQSREIETMLVPKIGEIYNTFTLRERVLVVKQKYNLSEIKITTVNYEERGDVFLSVKVVKRMGILYGGIAFEPIYGLSPEIGYFYPFGDSAVNLVSRAGYREGDLRKVEGDFTYNITIADSSRWGFFIGVNSSRLMERWETLDRDYTTISAYPVIGTSVLIKGIFLLKIYFREIVTRLYDYREEEYLNYDSRLTADLIYSNRYYLLKKRESTDLKISISGGRSELDDGYLTSTVAFKSSLSLFSWLRLIPRFNVYYTTSNERFSWVYVYGVDLRGFFDDFTASKWKNTGGLDLEFEISPEFLYIGFFINSGYFKDEYDEWTAKTGGGINCSIIYRGLDLQIYYAWDLSISPSEGGLYILASSRF
jgi:hypothetical protein